MALTGRLHPLLVHFPIALILIAAFSDLVSLTTQFPEWHTVAVAKHPVHEVQIVAARFAFEPAIVQVVSGESVRIVVRSKDGTHGFAITKLKIDLHIPVMVRVSRAGLDIDDSEGGLSY